MKNNLKNILLNVLLITSIIFVVIIGIVFIYCGSLLIKNIFYTQPEFTIYKEELRVSEEIYNYCIDYCKEKTNEIECNLFPCSDLIHKFEFEEINWGCENYHICKGISLKEDLSIEGLDNLVEKGICECVDCYDVHELDKEQCEIVEALSSCQNYKCGEYIVEVKE